MIPYSWHSSSTFCQTRVEPASGAVVHVSLEGLADISNILQHEIGDYLGRHRIYHAMARAYLGFFGGSTPTRAPESFGLAG